MTDMPNILSIAGADPSGGAGIYADIKTFSAHYCHGMGVTTALTAQNTQGVKGVQKISPGFVNEQLKAIFEDIDVAAVKIGMLGGAQTVQTVAATLKKYRVQNVVLDPVMVAQSGDRLASNETIEALKAKLLPLVSIITPNMPEAAVLLGAAYNANDMQHNAQALLNMGAQAVLLKGGHGDGPVSIDVFASQSALLSLSAPRIHTTNNHGTGCTLSSAIAARLAHGDNMPDACKAAKHYITDALQASDRLNVGKGAGPVHHFYDHWPEP